MYFNFTGSHPESARMLVGRMQRFRDSSAVEVFYRFVDQSKLSLAEIKSALTPGLEAPMVYGEGPVRSVSGGVERWDFESWSGETRGWGKSATIFVNTMLLEQYELLRQMAWSTPGPRGGPGSGGGSWRAVLERCEQRLEAVVLHEAMHWANPTEPRAHSASDRGSQFENAYYGRRVSVEPIEGWMGSKKGVPFRLGADHSRQFGSPGLWLRR